MSRSPAWGRLVPVCLAVLVLAWAASVRAQGPGAERLEFALRMFGVGVGRASLTTEPLAGGAAVRFVLEARSNAVVDMVFPVRDRIVSLARTDLSGALRYNKDISEGSANRTYDLLFSPGRVERFGPNGRGGLAVPLACHDPLSVFFVLRAMDAVSAVSADMPVTDGLGWRAVGVEIEGREVVSVPAGRYHTMHVALDLPGIDGVFRLAEGERYHVWVTDDAERVPVRLAARVRVGPFKGWLRVDLAAREVAAARLAGP